MSRAFVKETDDRAEDLPELPLSPHPNYVTPTGLARLRARLEAARAAGPQTAREQRWLEARIGAAIPVEPLARPPERVVFGVRVTAVDENDVRHTWRIVGEDEADPKHGLVSWVSPLACALQDARVGDVVTWRRPAGDLALELVAIEA